ncbi:thioesterase family protein [Hypoxylon fragiforme]|uniref:thioesterase family protein n=1 Tax=Hypoxylon fragiforme TaxID=63214 RepID=UPI0020C6971A|nr:thioesterase family protein [Hypoxylon fragiforme]KAI2613922.1 thioesterase family protein [Hypoxylon fragiforme]
MKHSILKDQINLKQTSSHTYTISFHKDWTIGRVLHGGCVAAALHHAAATHIATEPKLAAKNQPDILTLHLEFLRPCDARESTIAIRDLKVGERTSTLQLELWQGEKMKVVALATSINMDRSNGPTHPTAWALHPPPKPVPDFAAVLAHRPDEHWLPAHFAGDVIPFTRRMLVLDPRDGFPVDGICDAWATFLGDERMDATYLALMTDYIPSMSDTLLRNGGFYDARANFAKVDEWAMEHPGVPAELTNFLKDAAKLTIFNNTVTLDIEFKRRLPEEGLQWVFTRLASRMMEDGRLDAEVTLCDEKMDLVCVARQVILVLDAKRKFGEAKSSL